MAPASPPSSLLPLLLPNSPLELPAFEPHAEVKQACTDAVLAFERCAHDFDAHGALAVAEEFCRAANKRWGDASKAANGEDEAYAQALADAFCELRCVTLLMHPAVPAGCERICEHMGFAADAFFDWENAFLDPRELAAKLGEAPEGHAIVELPPRFDFFEKHPSQLKTGK